MKDEKKIKEILKLNEKYRANDFNGIKVDGQNFNLIHGQLPILLSAPHAVRQNRNGESKSAEQLTGAIVEFLCKTTGASGIVRTFNLCDDPNFESIGHSLAYKRAILKLIKQKGIACMIDIHGCNDNHYFDIDIGTNKGRNTNTNTDFLNIIKGGFKKVGKVTTNKKFIASKRSTICNYIHRKSNIPCFQIELNASIRKNPEKLLLLLYGFEKIIEELSNVIESKKVKEYEPEI